MSHVNYRRKHRTKHKGKACGEGQWWYGRRNRCAERCSFCSANRTAKNRRPVAMLEEVPR